MNGTVKNSHLAEIQDDKLYHIGFSKEKDDLPAIFGDTKFVLCGGSSGRMRVLAEMLAENLEGCQLEDHCRTERFVLYKVGPVICVSHGMGVPSMSVMLVETFKLIHYAGCKDVAYIRVGTSGGLGLEPGTVVISNGALNSQLEPKHHQVILGKEVVFDAAIDSGLANSLLESGKSLPFPVTSGITMCCDEFYEGQGRLDGAFCDYTSRDKFEYLEKAHKAGVMNIEMESTGFASYCNRAGLRGGVVCVALVNRLKGDQVATPKEILKTFEKRPCQLVTHFIKTSIASAKA